MRYFRIEDSLKTGFTPKLPTLFLIFDRFTDVSNMNLSVCAHSAQSIVHSGRCVEYGKIGKSVENPMAWELGRRLWPKMMCIFASVVQANEYLTSHNLIVFSLYRRIFTPLLLRTRLSRRPQLERSSQKKYLEWLSRHGN